MLSVSASTRVDILTAGLWETLVIPGARQIVIGAEGNDFAGQSYFVVGPDDEPRQLTRRMASGGVISPDGRWLVYSSRFGPLGARRADCRLRAVRLDGSDDHVVADSAPCTGQRLFAHDGTRLAVQISPASALIIDSSGQQEPRLLEYEGTSAQVGSLVRWTAADTKLVVIAATSVFFIDVATGESEEIYADEAARWITVRAATDTHMVVYSVIDKRDESGRRMSSYHQVLVDVKNGETTEFLDDCAYFWRVVVSVDGSAIIHAGCGDQGDWPSPDLWVRDLETGAERLLARLDTEVFSMWPSARTGRTLCYQPGVSQSLLVSSGGVEKRRVGDVLGDRVGQALLATLQVGAHRVDPGRRQVRVRSQNLAQQR